MSAPTETLILVTGSECHFCDRARALLADLDVPVDETPVESLAAEELAARGVALAFLPVLTDGQRVIAYGRFSEKRLRNELGL